MSISLNIDGKPIRAKKGMTVLDAAKKAGIYIPTLCDHALLEPAGSCRLCIVEIEHMQGYPTACTTPVTDGMVVKTDSPQLRALRRSIMELTLSEHPYTCLVCDRRNGCDDYQGTIRKVGVTTGCQYCPKNGACELQRLVEYLGIEEVDFPIAYRNVPVEQEDPFFDRDYNLCVLCGRCVRVCNDIRLNGTLNFGFRGDRTIVGTAFGKSHLDTGCEFCGACVDVCPTGALYDKRSKWEGCPDKSEHSICPYCSVGCSLSYNLTGNELVHTEPFVDGTLNKSQICVRGRFGVVDLVHHSQRLKKPMVKKNGHWIETTWDEALDRISEKFSQFGKDRFACIASPQGTNEDAYVLQKLTRLALGSNNITTSSVFAQNDFVEVFSEGQEAGIPPGAIEDIDKAGLIIVWGADLSFSHPVSALRVKQAQKAGAKLVVVDVRKTKLAERADLFLQPHPGTDPILIGGIMSRLVDKGLTDTKTGEGWTKVKNTLKTVVPAALKKETGISDGQIDALVTLLVKSNSVVFLYGSGLALQESPRDVILPLFNLALLISGSKVLPVLGECNLMGCLEAGCHPEFLPGMLPISNKTNRESVEKAYNVSLRAKRGMNIAEVIRGIEAGSVRCLYAVGELPETASLDKLEFLVVQAVYRTEAMDGADVILPAAHLNEVDGTVTNFEGRIQRLRKVSNPPGNAKPDWWICSHIAERMNVLGFDYRKSSDIFGEMASLLPGFKGLTLGKLGKRGVHPIRPAQADGPTRRRFLSFQMKEVETEGVRNYPFRWIGDWRMSGYRQGSLTDVDPGMERLFSEKHIEIHPQDAEKIGVREGDPIHIKFKNGEILDGLVLVTDRVPRKMIYGHMQGNGTAIQGVLKGNHHFVRIEKGAL